MKTEELRMTLGAIECVTETLAKIDKYLPRMRMSVSINGYGLDECLSEGDSAAIAAIVRTQWAKRKSDLEARLRGLMRESLGVEPF